MCDNKCVPEAREPKREEGKLENYLKAALYVYPRLERIERDWEEHIKNKAFMSYDYRVTTEKLSVYLAEEILRKEKIEKLRNTIDEALERLTEEERFLLELRYFRRKGRLKQFCQKVDLKEIGSERAYFRKQAKLQNKLEGILKCRGFTEEKFRKEYGEFEWLMSVCRFIEQGKEKNAAGRERSLVGLLSGKSDDTGTEVWLKGKKGTNIKSRRNNAAKRTEKLSEKRERREMPQAKKVYSSDS